MFITSNEVADLRSDFNGLDSDLTLLKATYEDSPKITMYIITDAPPAEEFASFDYMISDLLSQVNEREVTVMDTNALKKLAAEQTSKYDQFRSVFKSKIEHLRAVRVQIEKQYKIQGANNAKFKFIGDVSASPLADAFQPTAVVNPAKRRATDPLTPPNKRKKTINLTSAQIATFSQHPPPTGEMSQTYGFGHIYSKSASPPNSRLPNSLATVRTPSPLKRTPPMITWSTQSPVNKAKQLLAEPEPAQLAGPEPNTPTRSRPCRQPKPSPKKLANVTPPESQANATPKAPATPTRQNPKRRQSKPSPKKLANATPPESQANATKVPATPTRQNPKRGSKNVAYNIANKNCETVCLPPGVDPGTYFLLKHPKSTENKPISNAQHIWEMRFPNAKTSVPAPDLPKGLSADGLKDEIKNFIVGNFKKISERHPEETDEINRMLGVMDGYLERNKKLVAKGPVSMKYYDPQITEKLQQLTQEAKASKEDAELNKKDMDRSRIMVNVREKTIQAQNKEIAALKKTLQTCNKNIKAYKEEEKYYGSILEENDQLTAAVHDLKEEAIRYRNMISEESSIKEEMKVLKVDLDTTASINAKLQKQIHEFEQGTGNTMEQLLASMRRVREHKMAAKNEEEYIQNLVNDLQSFQGRPNAAGSLKRRHSD